MKRAEIENHSRAAFYLKSRGHGMTARAAYEAAQRGLDLYHSRAESSRAAQDMLAGLWESLGKVEPKAHSPEGKALQSARDAARVATSALSRVSAYRGTVAAPYCGTWQPGKPGLYYCGNPDSVFRDVTRAESICRDLPTGYYDNPRGESARDDSGLVIAYVAALPGRAGRCRYVAGFQYGSTDAGGISFDLGTIYEAPGDDVDSAQRDAARAADSMADNAAEVARDYEAAHSAGAQWADLAAEIDRCKAEIRALLQERREARAVAVMLPPMPATCKHLARAVSLLWGDIQEARKERAALASGQSESVCWHLTRYDDSGLEAFADGAGLTTAEARGVCS